MINKPFHHDIIMNSDGLNEINFINTSSHKDKRILLCESSKTMFVSHNSSDGIHTFQYSACSDIICIQSDQRILDFFVYFYWNL